MLSRTPLLSALAAGAAVAALLAGAADAGGSPAAGTGPEPAASTPRDTTPAPTVAVPSGEEGSLPADMIPLGRPTGSRDELAVVENGPVSVVPEPTTLAVFGVGLLLLFRRRSSV
jgi:hypothetical protein